MKSQLLGSILGTAKLDSVLPAKSDELDVKVNALIDLETTRSFAGPSDFAARRAAPHRSGSPKTLVDLL